RRELVRIGQIGEWFAIVALTLFTFAGRVHEAGILVLLFVVSVAKAFEFPALQSMLPSLVPAEILPRAMAASASAFQTAMIVGPALGGVLYAFGPGVVYAAAALLYLVAATRMAKLEYEQVARPREPVTLSTLFAGVRFIRARRDILGVISLDLFAVLLGGATALLPIFARDLLRTGPWGLGLLRAAPGVGALLMSLWLAHHALQRRVGMTMFAAVAGFG